LDFPEGPVPAVVAFLAELAAALFVEFQAARSDFASQCPVAA
jgi:hypothetical protein